MVDFALEACYGKREVVSRALPTICGANGNLRILCKIKRDEERGKPRRGVDKDFANCRSPSNTHSPFLLTEIINHCRGESVAKTLRVRTPRTFCSQQAKHFRVDRNDHLFFGSITLRSNVLLLIAIISQSISLPFQ